MDLNKFHEVPIDGLKTIYRTILKCDWRIGVKGNRFALFPYSYDDNVWYEYDSRIEEFIRKTSSLYKSWYCPPTEIKII